jgi:hypothetical protein
MKEALNPRCATPSQKNLSRGSGNREQVSRYPSRSRIMWIACNPSSAKEGANEAIASTSFD